MRSVLRRTRALPPNLRTAAPKRCYAFDGWTLDTVARQLTDAAGTLVSLTGGEYRLLRVFAEHPQQVLSSISS